MIEKIEKKLKSVFLTGLMFTVMAQGVVEAAPPTPIKVMAEGLHNPRGLTSDGHKIYVAEAGVGGDPVFPPEFHLGIGNTGSITKISHLNKKRPTYKRIYQGLPSLGAIEGGPVVVGISGLMLKHGDLYGIVSQSPVGIFINVPDANPSIYKTFGQILKFEHSHWTTIADVGDFDYGWTGFYANPVTYPWTEVDFPDTTSPQFPDSNPSGICTLNGRFYVVDAAANTLDEILPDGGIRIIAYFTNDLGTPGFNSVPTCVAAGPDGFLYVGTLSLTANIINSGSQSNIYKIDPNTATLTIPPTTPPVWASGFNPITGCGFGKDGAFYVTEFSSDPANFPTNDAGRVVRVKVNPDGSPGTRTFSATLHHPYGFTCDSKGRVYVSNFSSSATSGQVVRLDVFN